MAKSNFIFYLERTQGGGWDSVISVVVIADSEENAIEIVLEEFNYDSSKWPPWPDYFDIKKIGLAYPGEKPRVVTYYQIHG